MFNRFAVAGFMLLVSASFSPPVYAEPPVEDSRAPALVNQPQDSHRFQTGATENPHAPALVDKAGGYASTRLIVRFAPGVVGPAAGRATAPQGSPSSQGPSVIPGPPGSQTSPARAALSGPPRGAGDALRAAWGRWRITGARPLCHHPFRNAAAAAARGLDRTYILEVPRGTDTASMARTLKALGPEIEAVDVDAIGRVAAVIPSDPDFSLQYGLQNTGQTGGTVDADIDAPEAWALHTGLFPAVTVAIIDTGVDPHPEFAGRMVGGINLASGGDPTDTSDGCPHGTHVAGIVAARGDNGQGIAGVSWGAKIMPVRVFQFCAGFASDTAAGITWAVDAHADICNVSLQFCSSTLALQTAIDYAHDNGVLVVSAAGNNSSCGFGVVAFPAALANSMAVAATNDEDQRAPFSNTGPELDVAAPGDKIWSTWPGGGYLFLSGTSQATPCVSGLAALIESFAPNLTITEIRSILTRTSEDLGPPGWDDQFGYGRINAYRALVAADPTCFSSQAPQTDSLGPKNRYLSIRAGSGHRLQAVRVTFTSLPPPFDVFNGRSMWVGPSRAVSELPGVVDDSPPTSLLARLQCDPFFTDWTALGLVHVYDKNIVPAGSYAVQVVDSQCDLRESTFSPPLLLTTSVSGDVVKNCVEVPCAPADGRVDVATDLTAVLDKFVSRPGAPIKARGDLEPAVPDQVIDIRDVTRVIDSFRGFPFPYLPDDVLCAP